MIIITVQSPIMDVTRTFKKDLGSVTFLKRVKRLHATHAKHLAGVKPKRKQFARYKDYRAAVLKYQSAIMCGMLPLKINVEHSKPN